MRKVILAVLLAMMAGCTPTLSHTQIKEIKSSVVTSDGIDKVEATIIAQNFLLEQQFYKRLSSIEPYRVTKQTTWYKEGEDIEYAVAPHDRTGVTIEQRWILLFKDKKNSFLEYFPVTPFRVVIDAETGRIVTWGLDKLGGKGDVQRTRTHSRTQRL